MKTLYSLTFIALLLSIASCKKIENQYPSKTVKVSAPTITLKGDPVVILHTGDSYTDAGATFYDSLYLDQGDLTTSTTINTAEEGFYIVSFSAKNKYGFESTASRLVAVTNIADTFDISGDYARTSNGALATVSRIGRGVFHTDNACGCSYVDEAYFMIKSDSTIDMPAQYIPQSGGEADFDGETIEYTPTVAYSYTILGSAYGTAVRTFVKQ
ncbi:MAG: DUF5011 domain-containing protein [Chitinophagales bacterium]